MPFKRDMRRITKQLTTKLRTAERQSILEIGQLIVFGSPVDKGVFRNNWYPGFNSFNTETNENPEPSGSESLARLQQAVYNAPNVGTLYFTNSLPYAERLEFGYSAQAPSGMVRVAVAQWTTIVQRRVSQA